MSSAGSPAAAVPAEFPPLPGTPAQTSADAPLARSDADAAAAAAAPPAAPAVCGTQVLLLRAYRWLGLLAIGAALVLASWLRPILVPVLIALLLALTLAPALRVLVGLRVPRMIGAALLLSATLGASSGVVLLLVSPAEQFVREAPAALKRLEQIAHQWRQPIEAASDAAQRLVGTLSEGSANASNLGSGVSDAMLGMLAQAPLVVASVLATFFLAFMMLVHSDASLRKLVGLLPSLSRAKDLVGGTRQAQHELSRYMLVITCINFALGGATALVLSLLGVEHAVLWGGIAALANYAPYLGPALVTLLLVLVGFGQHAEIGAALLVPASFVILTTIEGQIISPLLIGRHLRLDPLVIVLALLLLGWLWGVPGLLIAVPLLTCVRVLSERLHGDGKLVAILTAAR